MTLYIPMVFSPALSKRDLNKCIKFFSKDDLLSTSSFKHNKSTVILIGYEPENFWQNSNKFVKYIKKYNPHFLFSSYHGFITKTRQLEFEGIQIIDFKSSNIDQEILVEFEDNELKAEEVLDYIQTNSIDLEEVIIRKSNSEKFVIGFKRNGVLDLQGIERDSSIENFQPLISKLIEAVSI